MQRPQTSAILRIFTLCLFAWGASVLTAQPHPHADHAAAHAEHTRVGDADTPTEVPELIGFRALTVDGQIVRLGLEGAAGPVALVFLDDGCTISRRYVPRLNELAITARTLGLALYGVISNPAISPAAARAFRDEFQLDLPLLFDANGSLARQLAPDVVPSAFVVDLAGRVTYRGRIDDRFPSLTKIRRQATVHDLARAIEAVSTGQVAEAVHTPAIGCAFSPWPSPESAPTYATHVAPILNANCTECHRSGGVAPFALDTYDAAKRWSTMVSAMTRLGLMPPWRAKKGFGHFREERFLTDRQIAALAEWDRAGAPKGDESQLLPIPHFENKTWSHGEPDLVLTMPEAYAVPAAGEDIYRYFVLPMELAEDAVVVGMDFQPGDASVVHHCNYFVDYSGRARALDREDPELGFSVFGTGGFMSYDGANALGAWAPGVAPYTLPEGRGFDLPRGGDIVLEVHYHLSGKATRDQSSIAFYFAKGPVQRGVSALFVGTQDVDIPAGEANYWRKLTLDVPAAMRVVDLAPHMHYLGREARVVATLPDGAERPLLHVTDWDLRWQGIYSYREPIDLPAGSTIEAHFRFDNSSSNPGNPNAPPKRVSWGWGSDQEMAELYLTVIPEDADAEQQMRRAARASWMRSADPRAAPVVARDPEAWLAALIEVDLWSPEGEQRLTTLSVSDAFEAVLALAKKRARKTRSADAHALSGSLLAIASAYGETVAEQWDLATAADAALVKALRLDPNHGSALLTRAALYAGSQDKGSLRQAVGLYRRLLEKATIDATPEQLATAYLDLGRLLAQLGNRDQATVTLREGVARYPEHQALNDQLVQLDPLAAMDAAMSDTK